MTGDDLESLRGELRGDLVTMLRDHAGLTCQALGPEQIEGRPCERVYVTGAKDDYVMLFIDAETGYPMAEQTPSKDPVTGGPVVARTVYGQYGNIGGMNLPSTLVINHDGKEFAKGSIDGFEADPAIDPAIFAKP